VEGQAVPGRLVALAHRLGERIDLRLQLDQLLGRELELLQARLQQVVDVVHRVGDRGVGANQRALHAARAQIGDEFGHVAPEQALVLPRAGGRRHEHARAGQHRRLADRAFAERRRDHLLVVLAVEEATVRRRAADAAHARRDRHAAARLHQRLRVDRLEFSSVVIDLDGGLEAFAHHREVALHHRAALGAELLRDLLADLVEQHVARCAGHDAIDVPAHGADERDAHHARLELGRRGVPLRHGEAVQDQELDLLRAQSAPRVLGQFLPHLERGQARLQDERAAVHQAAQRVGVAEHPVIG